MVAATTQLAMHIPPRYPFCKHMEKISAIEPTQVGWDICDWYHFQFWKVLEGATCTQIFNGTHLFYVYADGMKSDSKGPSVLEDFVWDKGAPYALHNDNLKTQTGIAWQKLLNKCNIAAEKHRDTLPPPEPSQIQN